LKEEFAGCTVNFSLVDFVGVSSNRERKKKKKAAEGLLVI
jgi:hypothetical protein